MKLMRPVRPSSSLRSEYRFIRTITCPHHVVFDDQRKKFVLSSKAFGPSKADKSLSGELEQLLIEDGLRVDILYPAVRSAVGAAAVAVGDIVSLGLSVHHDPVPDNWYHGAVRGITKSKKRLLQEKATELIPIDQKEAARLDILHQAKMSEQANLLE